MPLDEEWSKGFLFVVQVVCGKKTKQAERDPTHGKINHNNSEYDSAGATIKYEASEHERGGYEYERDVERNLATLGSKGIARPQTTHACTDIKIFDDIISFHCPNLPTYYGIGCNCRHLLPVS